MSSMSTSSVFRRSTPWRSSQLQALSLEEVSESEDGSTRPPNSPLTPERELAPGLATETALPSSDGPRDGVGASQEPTSAFSALSIRSPDQTPRKIMGSVSHTSPPTTGSAFPGPLLGDGHPRHSVHGHSASLEDSLSSHEGSRVSGDETSAMVHEAHVRADETLSLDAGLNPLQGLISQARVPGAQSHVDAAAGQTQFQYLGHVLDRSIRPVPAYLLPESAPRASPSLVHPITGRPLPEPVIHPPHNMFSHNMPLNLGVRGGPSNVQLLGYAGLEDFPYTGQMINSKTHKAYAEFFQYDNTSCPAGIIYADPKRERATGEAWLYVRNVGDVQWKRDYLAERSGMRHWIYLKNAEEGWQWEQILGDVLDAKATLNLWVKRRKSMVGKTGPFCVDDQGRPRPGVLLRPTG